MTISLPPIFQYLFRSGKNNIVKFCGPPKVVEDAEITLGPPFKITSDQLDYFITSDVDADLPIECEYVLLSSKKPTKRNLEDNSIKLVRWLRHPLFETITPEEITLSWKDQFKFVREDEGNNIEGLRPPQLGALYAILAHVEHTEDKAIVVLPTGTGKTEVMLSALVALRCSKLLVTVPSIALRSQLALKFLTLGLLKRFNIVPVDSHTPIVGVMGNKINDRQELENFIAACNVIVTTMPLVAGYNEEFQTLLAVRISHFFVDEAHHSEAQTWSDFISKVNYKKVFLFTATPFRTDERRLQGKFIFNFPLREAQIQRYYKRINFLPVRVYDPAVADERIVQVAVGQLSRDRQAGFPHLLMARCANKRRAEQIAPLYRAFAEFNTVVVYTGVPALAQKVRDIKNRVYDIIICVDMLGEGFDLPELKIAAIHDERQSIPITLQFVGRFTRPSFDILGEASFIANIAYPPIQDELDRLYAHDADWNLLLPDLSAESTDRQINFRAYLDGFAGLDNSLIPFQHIRPAMSTIMYNNGGGTWNPGRWREGIQGIDDYEHQYHNVNAIEDTLVIILGRIARVEWGNFDTVQNMQWDMIVVYWDRRPNINRVFVHYSMDNFTSKKLVNAIFGEQNEIFSGMNIFRIFHEVKRLSIYNFGGRPPSGADISFRLFFGRGIQDGLSLLESGTLIKNNIFGAGYKNGEKVTLGCSVSGKVWSYERGNLQDLVAWCQKIGDIITDDNIDPNTVLENTLSPQTITERPAVMPISVDWHPFVYGRAEDGFIITLNGTSYDLSSAELNIVDVPITSHLRFALDIEHNSIIFEMILDEQQVGDKREPRFTISQVGGPAATISYGRKDAENLVDFFAENCPIIWFADGSQLMRNLYVRLKEHPGRIPLENIIEDDWLGVDLHKESQGIAPL